MKSGTSASQAMDCSSPYQLEIQCCRPASAPPPASPPVMPSASSCWWELLVFPLASATLATA
jgi:hypothetical protein